MSAEYGWLGRLNRKNDVKPRKSTDISKKIIQSLNAQPYTSNGINSGNVIEIGGKPYYILGATTEIWTIDPLIADLPDNGYVVFALDSRSDNNTVTLQIASIKKINELIEKGNTSAEEENKLSNKEVIRTYFRNTAENKGKYHQVIKGLIDNKGLDRIGSSIDHNVYDSNSGSIDLAKLNAIFNSLK